MYLEEIDPGTGMSLSALEISGLGGPFDAAFDESGDLWVTEFSGPIIPGTFCVRVVRVTLATSTVEPNSIHCGFIGDPAFANIADIRETALEIPTLDHVGRLCLLGLLLLSGLLVLRRTGGPTRLEPHPHADTAAPPE